MYLSLHHPELLVRLGAVVSGVVIGQRGVEREDALVWRLQKVY